MNHTVFQRIIPYRRTIHYAISAEQLNRQAAALMIVKLMIMLKIYMGGDRIHNELASSYVHGRVERLNTKTKCKRSNEGEGKGWGYSEQIAENYAPGQL